MFASGVLEDIEQIYRAFLKHQCDEGGKKLSLSTYIHRLLNIYCKDVKTKRKLLLKIRSELVMFWFCCFKCKYEEEEVMIWPFVYSQTRGACGVSHTVVGWGGVGVGGVKIHFKKRTTITLKWKFGVFEYTNNITETWDSNKYLIKLVHSSHIRSLFNNIPVPLYLPCAQHNINNNKTIRSQIVNGMIFRIYLFIYFFGSVSCLE